MLKFFLCKNVLFLFIAININCQKIETNKQDMNTIFYRDDLNNPLELNIKSVNIKSIKNEKSIRDYLPGENQKNYLTHYLNTERNSRLNSPLPNADLWEIKWKSDLNSSAIPWFLLFNNERIIIQNESGWQLFDTSGKNIANGIKADGDIFIDESEDIFYINDPSGFIDGIDLTTGERKFYIYPYMGKGFDRSVIFSDGNRIINSAFELPVMTHDSPIKTPEVNILETIVTGKSRETDADGVLKSAASKENLICKSGKLIKALHDSTIIIAVPNHIYFINADLQITNDFVENFIPLEMSIDEEMRIYLLVEIQVEENLKNKLWIIDSTGNLLSETEIPPIPKNYLAPPAIDYKHNIYIRYEEKILAIDPNGSILWEEHIQKPLAGIAATKDYLLTAEGNILTAFDYKGERRFFYNFDDELATAALLVDDQIFVATKKHLYCLTPKK